jgi:acyl-CoA dehydrogenase
VRRLGAGGWLRTACRATGGALPQLDSRALVLLRETLAFYSPLADFAFAMQGLGSGAISLGGSASQRRAYLPGGQRRKIAAFALSEPDAGSDVAAMKLSYRRAPIAWRPKTAISRRPQDLDQQRRHRRLLLRVRQDRPEGGSRGISAFIVDADTPGWTTRPTSP